MLGLSSDERSSETSLPSSIEKDLSQATAKDTKSRHVERTQTCDLHKEPYNIFCVTCQTVICPGCLVDHNKHVVGNIQAAREDLKAPLLKKTEKCEEIRVKLTASLASLKELDDGIQRHEGQQKTEIVKAYNTALEALNTWKNYALMELEKRHCEWYSRCRGAVKDLEIKIEEVERIMRTSADITSSTDVIFLQNAKELNISIDSLLSEINNSLKTQEDVKMKLGAALDLDCIVSRELTVKETSPKQVKQFYAWNDFRVVLHEEQPHRTLNEPVLKFIKTSNMRMKISDNGSLIEGKKLEIGKWYTSWTGGRLQSGHITWGLEITVKLSSSDYVCQYLLGVVHEGCDFSSNCGTTSWCIAMQYRDNKVRFYIPSDCRGDVTSGCDQDTTYTGPQRLGFSLNCNERTLTVTNIDKNQVMATVRDVDLSQPVIPAVGFVRASLTSWPSVSVRIIPWGFPTFY